MARQRTASPQVRQARAASLARLRSQRGLTLAGLGERMGFSAEQVRKYQNNTDFLSAAMCWRFARALDCPFLTLFDPPLEGVAEAPALFLFDDADDSRLDELLSLARQRLTGDRRTVLRDFLLDMLEDEETASR